MKQSPKRPAPEHGAGYGHGRSPSTEHLDGIPAKPQARGDMTQFAALQVPAGNEKVNSKPFDLSKAEGGTER